VFVILPPLFTQVTLFVWRVLTPGPLRLEVCPTSFFDWQTCPPLSPQGSHPLFSNMSAPHVADLPPPPLSLLVSSSDPAIEIRHGLPITTEHTSNENCPPVEPPFLGVSTVYSPGSQDFIVNCEANRLPSPALPHFDVI